MDKKEFSDLEDQIMNTVKSALNAIDFATLKRDFTNKADDTMSKVKSKIKEYNEKVESKYTEIDKSAKNKISLYIDKRPTGTVSGILYIVIGSMVSVPLGVLLIIYMLWTSLISGFLVSSTIGLGILVAFFVGSIGLIFRGVNLRKRVRRFKRYVRYLDNKGYCLIEDLANTVRMKNKFVIKDLKRMIELGMFKEAHIDEEKTYLMINDDVYKDYLNLKAQEANRDKQREEQEVREEKFNSEGEELRAVIQKGKNYTEEIEVVKNKINNREFILKLDKLRNIVIQILNYIEKNPKKIQEVNKFINHYLPITIKLVNSYKELNEQQVQGENIKTAKNEIEKSIDVINIAFEKLLDDLFEDVALDISTDISVLKTLFTQEGLTDKSDFKK
ncbi:5-bromo-4-chloroindolyl phosphate hydrolysis protein [Clostridium sartagoforme AAU1]|uniref:5-bromo-4-chloroindolyl phosphate hydrolysis protein n=1 Tax=Clostridium sartagoforme AAU1 TaxID=1202534 RepID=R9CBB5_9CLOT|nr:5-bromo-4-chloroindolyl phosphate hydrolysis family protein [Clostridium sartagoforme]EOR24481.1 5-bromo-4-chloroindolyl phosphate hydrolysis protein [Clostridium sartagoforme AAU1]